MLSSTAYPGAFPRAVSFPVRAASCALRNMLSSSQVVLPALASSSIVEPSRVRVYQGLHQSRPLDFLTSSRFLNGITLRFHPTTRRVIGGDEGSSSHGAGSKRRSRGPVMAAKKKEGQEGNGAAQEVGRYKNTVCLPTTDFGLRANSAVREPQIQAMWEEKRVLSRLEALNSDGEIFTLHDGPPYANGDLHTGHALNKILKDFINRYQLLQGRRVNFIPGWDCHGLPIELKVLQSMNAEARKDLTPIKLRKKAAQFALKTVENQKKSFKRFGVWGDFEEPYTTLSPQYEAAQIGVFGAMVLNGHIYRGKKPVHWSPSSQTALAEAELEYPEGHTSRSIYVAFKMTHLSPQFPPDLAPLLPDLALAIWTTTPWTIPANAGVAVNDKLSYAVVEIASPLPVPTAALESEGETAPKKPSTKPPARRIGAALTETDANGLRGAKYLVVAEDLVPALQSKWGVPLEVRGTLLGASLENSRYKHPLADRESPVVIGGDYITTESGTGLVHTAPGHGQEDYQTGLKYGLPMLSPVDDRGNFTDEAGPSFAGQSVLGEGNIAVIDALDGSSALLLEEAYEHKYPYDWRTKKPTIFRATEQWFASVEGFREKALEAIAGVQWFPPQGEKRITAMTVGRSDWCISRQRSWGVPIPVFYNTETGEPLMTASIIRHVQGIVAEKGSDAWFQLSVEELLPEEERANAHLYRRGTDTMDVWFDSGSSWAAVLEGRPKVRFPADLYLEGSDQHRGWFQSSLLTSVATKGVAPYNQVLTHGFVLDERGRKMSKSEGNVIDPLVIIQGGKNQKTEPANGADVLRLWVASVDYTGDVLIGPNIIRQTADVYRKLRGTLRYLLSNLYDWKPESGTVAYEDLPSMDKYCLSRLASVMDEFQSAYSSYQFYRFFQLLQRFVVVDMSNFYFDVSKDRLYVGAPTGQSRRGCQTTIAAVLLCLVRAAAPVVPHMAEDAWESLPFPVLRSDGSPAETVFEAGWPTVDPRWRSFTAEDVARWEALLQVRGEVNKVIEQARNDRAIGASLEAKVYLYSSDSDLAPFLRSMAGPDASSSVDSLRQVFIASQVEVVPSVEEFEALTLPYTGTAQLEGRGDLLVGVTRADGSKCERCWNFSVRVGGYAEHPTLCERCHPIILEAEADVKTPIAV